MKIQSSELKSLLKRVSPVKSDTIILSDGGVVASDSDITVCAGSSKFTGFTSPISVNARKFSSVSNRMSGEIEITVSGNTLTLKSAKTKVEMETSVPKNRTFTCPEKMITLPLGPMKDLLKYVSGSANTNKAAAQGGVVQFESVTAGLFEDEKVVGFEAMATDDKRCAFESVVADVDSPFKYLITLPAVAALQVLEGKTVQVGEAASYYYLKSSDTTIYANKLSKQFPDYKNFLPKFFTFQATVDAAEFKRVLHAVEPMIQDVEQFAVFVHFLDGRLTVKTVGKGGAAEDEMEYLADPLADVTEFKTKINHRFLSDYFSSASGDVIFNANKPESPVILESGNRKMMIAPVAGGS